MSIKNVRGANNSLSVSVYSWEIVFLSLGCSLLPLQAQDSETLPGRVNLVVSSEGGKTAVFTHGDFQYRRVLLDRDNDEWCDLWCEFFPKIKKTLTKDSDGDSMTDYEEMVLMQDPFNPNSVPRYKSPTEIAKEKHEASVRLFGTVWHRDSEARRLFNLRQLQPPPPKSQARFRSSAALRKKNTLALAKSLAEKSAKQRLKIESLREKHGIERGGITPHLGSASIPQKVTYDSVAAQAVGADQIWPGGSAVYEDATGLGVPIIGVWDAGGVDQSASVNPGLAGRLHYGDSLPELTAELPPFTLFDTFKNMPHAVLITEIIALKKLSSDPDDPQGLAYESEIKNFTDKDDYQEMATEAASGMLFSNHSYSPQAGWDSIGSGYFDWYGPSILVNGVAEFLEEDPEFGAYTENSKTIDSIIYTAKTYLSVHSASNEATDWGEFKSYDKAGAAAAGLVPSYGAYEIQADDSYVYVTSSDYHPSDGGIPDPTAVRPENVDQYLEFYPIGGIGIGTDTIKSTACAKNNLSVGAAYGSSDYVTNAGEIGLSYLSSRGPTDDGRVKPDLVAPGRFEKNNSTVPIRIGLSTSVATPAVTGTLALLQQINQDSGGPLLLASTWKVLLLNTATDGTNLNPIFKKIPPAVGFERLDTFLGTPAQNANLVGPDYFFGWGMVNAEKAASLLVKNLRSRSRRAHLCEHLLTDGSVIEIPIEHDGSSEPLKIMLCWTDPPHQDAAIETLSQGVVDPEVGPANGSTARLENDLDLRIIAPDNSVLKPWVLDKNNPLSPAVPGDNTLDNVEQIIINAPVPGTYTIQISHKNSLITSELVSGSPDQHRHILGGDQEFSLSMSGNLAPDPAIPVVRISSISFENNNLDKIWMELDGFVGVNYQLESSEDLENWTAVEDPFIVTTRPQPLIVHYQFGHRDASFFRVKEILPLE